MKTSTRFRHTLTILLLLFSLLLNYGCTPSPKPTPETPPPPSPAPTKPIPTPTPAFTLSDLAEEIADEFGVVTQVVEGESTPVIFVFEERHNSILGQIEIAIMLNRLYEDYDMRTIGLEGLINEDGPLDVSWAHTEPYFQPDQMITGREDVFVQTLQNGEISSAEVMALIYHDAIVEGLDDGELYAFDIPTEVFGISDWVLYKIAVKSMSNVDYEAWKALYESDQKAAAFNFALSSTPFTADMHDRLTDVVDIASAAEWLSALEEIKAQAAALEVPLEPVEEEHLALMVEYFENVDLRSDFFVATLLELVEGNSETPVAITVGAMHTARVVELLTEAGVSFVVIRPISLAEGSEVGLLSSEAFRRKQQGHSVAPDGSFSALFDPRGKKPPPVAQRQWYEISAKVKMELQMVAWHHVTGEPVEAEITILGSFNEAEHLTLSIGGAVIPPDGGNPIVEWSVVDKNNNALFRGQVQHVGGEEKVKLTLFGRYKTAYDQVSQGEAEAPEEAGVGPKYEDICSSSRVTVIETGA